MASVGAERSSKHGHSDHRRVMLGVRPARLAVLIDASTGWENCLSLIEALTERWGGTTYAIIPYDEHGIDARFRSLLARHDPDWFAASYATGWPDDALLHDLRSRHAVAWPVGATLDRLEPNDVEYPLTPTASLIPYDWLTFQTMEVTVKGPELVKLLLASTTGLLSDGLRNALHDRKTMIATHEITATEPQALDQVAEDLWRPLKRHLQRPYYPCELSSWHLDLYPDQNTDPHQHPAIVVCGATVADFAYFWTLRAVRGLPECTTVYWLPRLDDDWIEEHPVNAGILPALGRAIRLTVTRDLQDKPGVLVTSISLVDEEFMRATTTVTNLLNSCGDALQVEAIVYDDFNRLLPYVLRAWERDNPPERNVELIQFHEGEGMALLATPTPTSFDGVKGSLRWMIEGEIAAIDGTIVAKATSGLRLPVHPWMTSLLIRTHGLQDTRVTRLGFAYAAVDAMMPVSRSSMSLVRPRLKLPTGWEVFRTLCAAQGLALELSDKGRYEQEFIVKTDGLALLGELLRDRRAAAVLRLCVDPSPNQQGISDNGVLIDKRTRVVNLKAIYKQWNTIEGVDSVKNWADSGDFATWCLEVGLFQRGLLIKCPICTKSDWYALGEVTDRVTCHRCGRTHIYNSTASIYFRLDPLIALAMEQRSYLPLLALDHLRQGATASFLFTPANKLKSTEDDSERTIEIDFLACVDGDVVLGEAKAGTNLSRDDRRQLNRYVKLCTILRPTRLVVCTDQPNWEESSAQYLNELAAKLMQVDVHLVRLTGHDLGWATI